MLTARPLRGGILTQQLIPTADGTGRVVATEVLYANFAIQNLIRENKAIQIPSMLQSGMREGMHTLNSDLYSLVRRQKITKEEALKVSSTPTELEKMF